MNSPSFRVDEGTKKNNSPSFRVDEGAKKPIPLLLEGVPEGAKN